MTDLLHFVRSHGFVAWIAGLDRILVVIPWVHIDGKSTGEDTFTIRTLADARRVLGY